MTFILNICSSDISRVEDLPGQEHSDPKRLTFQEVGQVVERPVVGVSVPLLQGQAVEGLQAERLPLAVHHDHFTAVSVQTRHVLKGRRKAAGVQEVVETLHHLIIFFSLILYIPRR